MGSPRFCSVNVVVPDVVAATSFLEALGIEIEETFPGWEPHHRNFADNTPDVDADLDSPAFAAWWGGTPDGFTGVVVNFRTDSADEVDRLHARALDLGATDLKAPWDAFWGSRYAIVLGPGPLCVGFMNEPDDARRTMPPSVDDFA